MLGNYWPGPRALFYSLASDIALAFLTAYPTPQAAARLGEARMAAFLRRNPYRGGKKAGVLLERLRAAVSGDSLSRLFLSSWRNPTARRHGSESGGTDAS
jgi:hypothetical protein